MASYDFHAASGRYHIRFRYGDKPFKRALQLEDEKEAQRVCSVVEETIKDLKRGRLTMPPGAEAGAFLISGGRLDGKPKLPDVSEACQATLKGLFGVYERDLTAGSEEANSIGTEGVHRRHLVEHFGKAEINALSHRSVQEYVNARAADEIVAVTIRKELATLCMIWNWGLHNRHIAAPLPWNMSRLTFPNEKAKEPFKTWTEIEQRIKREKLTGERAVALWEYLYLDEGQIKACLAYVREHAAYPFVYPMFAFAAYTGARRGEILRSVREDFHFDTGTVAIHQKKADRSKRFTFRHVPLHPELIAVMQVWFKEHPGTLPTICTMNGLRIGERMATKYFRGAVRGGKWKVLHGFHVFRHSLASIMASKGIDQRVINEILGHSTEDMVKRYRHLFPQKKEETIGRLFA